MTVSSPASAAPAGFSSHVIRQIWEAVLAVHSEEAHQLHALRDVRDVDGYRDALMCLYGVHQPVEAALAAASPLWRPLGVDLAGVCRLASLRKDLAAVGVSDAECAALPRCSIPPILSLPQALGVTFTLLGSVFGGRKTCERVAEILPGAPTGFFSDSGPVSWKRFAEVTEAALPDPAGREQAVQAAVATMRCVASWAAAWTVSARSSRA
ncbi:biliverdin-producing heme oxygenase [Streptosporangium sp. NPDC048047]|uniref:biliverdin-producing heme oxygenase n=1 Tax=Streptosporangium sp. NPDC048047 TaxID=3155748 RepID=UPI00342F2F40